jgi:membrane-associated phospholipid phosphatase
MLGIAWIVLFVAALYMDVPVARWVANHRPVNKNSPLVMAVKSPGSYYVTMGIAVLLYLCHPLKARAAALPLIAGALGGAGYSLMKWFVGRHRPVLGVKPFDFHPFVRGLRGLYSEPGLSFPSGHTCLAFATAMSLAILVPRWRAAWFVIAAAVAAERVLENAHYVSDVIAGIGLGMVCALLTQGLQKRYWPSDETASPRGFPVGR